MDTTGHVDLPAPMGTHRNGPLVMECVKCHLEISMNNQHEKNKGDSSLPEYSFL